MTLAGARTLTLLLASTALSGCCWLWKPSGPETLVIVVPSRHDGHVGAVVVTKGEERQVLNRAYASARVKTRGQVRPTSLKSGDIERLFGAASAALPRKSMSFMLHFELAGRELTPDSSAQLERVLAEVADWEAAEIEVVGHTDRMGTPDNNAALSLKRAQHVRRLLLARGASAQAVQAVGRGESEPVVPTEDGVAEAANRRVEVTIR